MKHSYLNVQIKNSSTAPTPPPSETSRGPILVQRHLLTTSELCCRLIELKTSPYLEAVRTQCVCSDQRGAGHNVSGLTCLRRAAALI